MRTRLRFGQTVYGVLLMLHSTVALSIIDRLRANLSSEWNEDLEPVLESVIRRFRKEIIPIGQEIIYDETLSSECLRSIVKLGTGLRDQKLWALKFVDSAGGLTVNKLEGSLSSIGGYDECLSIRVPQGDEPAQLDFGGKYCTVSINLDRQPMFHRVFRKFALEEPLFLDFLGSPNATWAFELLEKLPLGLRIGICIPSNCEESIIAHFAQKLGGKYGLRARAVACRDNVTPMPIHTGTWIAGFVFLVAFILVAWGTAGDCRTPPENQDLSAKLMRCFSVRVTYLKLTSPVGEENRDLDCIHGIRVLSSLWILLSHTYLGDPGLYDRGMHFLAVLQSPVFSIITQGMLAVDTFFALTGILLYRKLHEAILKHHVLDKISLIQFVSMVIFRRAIRLLVPAFAVICMLYLLPVITSGPGMDIFYPFFQGNCDQRWWAQLFFINNMFSFELACMGNQWYNAADMQLLIIMILPTVFIVRRPRQGILPIVFLLVFSNVYTAILTIYYDATPTTLVLPRQMFKILQFALRINDQSLPYLATVCVGVLGGYLIEQWKERKISPVVRKVSWIINGILSFIILFIVTVWHRRGEVGLIESVLYGVLYRPLWGVCVVWLVFACASGQAPALRWMLNRPNLVTLSRMSYCFYLSQYIIMILKNFTARYVIAFTYYQNFRDFFADMVFNYLLAFLTLTLFEAPTYALEKLIFDRSIQPISREGQAQADDKKSGNDLNRSKNLFDGSASRTAIPLSNKNSGSHELPFNAHTTLTHIF